MHVIENYLKCIASHGESLKGSYRGHTSTAVGNWGLVRATHASKLSATSVIMHGGNG
jgi:hypothetical protein